MRALRGAARPCARASRTTSPHSASISAPAQRHVVGHARSRFLVDAQHARCHAREQCVRQAQQRDLELDSIRAALIEGELSGEPEPFDFAAFKRRKLEEHG